MTKKILLALLIIHVSYANNTHIKLKTSFETNSTKALGKDITSIKYIPIEGKIYHKTNHGMFNVFFKLRGERKNIHVPDTNFVFTDSKMYAGAPEGHIDAPVNENNLIDTLLEEQTKLQNLYSGVHLHYHGPHEHDEIGLDEDHSDEEEHEHNHDTFSPITKKWVKPVFLNNDFQAKIGVEYLPNSLNKFALTYIPTIYNGDDIMYYKSFIFDIKNTNLIKDKFAITFNPRLTTINHFTPYILNTGVHLRYAIDKDTTIGLSGVNKFQLDNLKDYRNFKNSITLFYDYNKEKFRAHKFYEILDHEHEKLEQYKLEFKFDHTGTYTLPDSKKEKLKYASKVNQYEFKLKQKIKKPDFLIKGLTFENVTDLNYTLGYIENAHKYLGTYKLYSLHKPTQADKNLKVDEIYNKENHLQEFSHTWSNEDLSLIEGQVGVLKGAKMYFIKKRKEAIYFDQYSKEKRINLFELKNVTKIDYNNFKLKNSLYLSKDNFFKTFALDNELTLSYLYKNGIFEAKPYITHNYDVFYKKDLKLYDYNVLTPGIDVSINYKKDNFSLKLGTDIKNDFQFRRATRLGINDTLGDQNEIDKLVKGSIIYVKPYLKVENKLGDHLTVKGDFSYEYMKSFDVTRGSTYTMYKPIEFKQHNIKTKVSLQYDL